MYTKNTKIVCTLGPSSDSISEITSLVQAGMNVARLNFSHGSYEHHLKLITNLRKVEKLTGKRIGILQDLQGPKIRIGKIPEEGIRLVKGDIFTLTTKNIVGKKTKQKIEIPIQYKKLTKELKKNDIILINDGLIETKVLKVSKDGLLCQVKFGEVVKKGNGLNFPTASISAKTITDKDKKDLDFGLKNGVDFVALSFVKSKKDIEELRKLIEKKKKHTQIIAKVERHEAVKNLKEIIKASDGVMVARGDLGADMAPEQVPIVQKRMIALANKYGKPVITATQVLQSMVLEPRATRAEVSDAANAVFDHTDAIMLSNETAVGKYPAKAAATLSRVAQTVETELQKHEELIENLQPTNSSSLNATCLNGCELAKNTNADYIVAYTENGYTAKNIAKFRPFTPIITITPKETTAHELTLVWGINKIFIKNFKNEDPKKLNEIIKFLKIKKILKKGNTAVIICNASKKEKLISTIKI